MAKGVETESEWVLPENMKYQAKNGEGVYESYDAFAKGSKTSEISAHAIVDDQYAIVYARNIFRHLTQIGARLDGPILDVGCAIGTITGGMKKLLGPQVEVHGIDLSESAVGVATKKFPDCRFLVESADELISFDDGQFGIIHAREFYPFSRSGNTEFHIGFLRAFHNKLKPDGVLIAVQIIDAEGLADSLGELKRRARGIGFKRIFRLTAVPYRIYSKFSNNSHRPLIYTLIQIAGWVVEKVRPGTVSYLYVFQK
jgi:SAM-dependent methyltransferase